MLRTPPDPNAHGPGAEEKNLGGQKEAIFQGKAQEEGDQHQPAPPPPQPDKGPAGRTGPPNQALQQGFRVPLRPRHEALPVAPGPGGGSVDRLGRDWFSETFRKVKEKLKIDS
nr:C1q-related factor isoform X2 [Pan paniscus]